MPEFWRTLIRNLLDGAATGEFTGSDLVTYWQETYEVTDQQGYNALMDLKAAVDYAVNHIERDREAY